MYITYYYAYLIYNAVSHNLVQSDLSNVKVVYLPPNVTSIMQPLDQGIIKSFKSQYKRLLVQFLLDSIEKFDKLVKPNIKEAIEMIRIAWRNVTADTIENCWRHSGILPIEKPIIKKAEQDIEKNSKRIEELLQDLKDKYSFVPKKSHEPQQYDVCTVKEFLSSDEDLQTGESYTIEEIIADVSNSRESENLEDLKDECENVEDKNLQTYKDPNEAICTIILISH